MVINTIMKSKFLKLNKRDFLRGMVVAMGTAFFYGLSNMLFSGVVPNMGTLVSCSMISLSAGLTYILKNLFTNSYDEMFNREAEQKLNAQAS